MQLGDSGELSVDIDPGAGLLGGAVGAFALTVVLGAIMVAVAPRYTESKMASLRRDPVGAVVYGIALVIAVALVALLLLFSVVGIPVVIVLFVPLVLIWGIGSAIAFLAIAEGLLDGEGEWLLPLLVAGALSGGLALTGIGGVVSFCIGAAGFGAVLRDYL